MARTLGIDLGPHALRAVLVRTSLRKVEIERCFEIPYLQEGQEAAAPLELRIAALRELVAAVGRAPDSVIVSLDGEQASLRPIDLPEAAAKRIAEVLPFELEAVLPYEADTTVLTHQLIDRADGKLRLLAAAVPKHRVESLIGTLAVAGVTPSEIAVGAAALDGLSVLAPVLNSPGAQIILDVSGGRADFCIVRGGVAEFARTISLNAPSFGQASPEQFARALTQTIVSYRAMGRAEPEAIWLVGEEAHDPAFQGWIASQFDMVVQPLPLPPMPSGPPENGVFYARAIALATRTMRRGTRLDARQGEFASKRAMGAIRQHAPLLAGCAALIVASIGYSSWASYRVVSARNTQLREELAHVTKTVFGSEAFDAASAQTLLTGGARTADPMPKFDAYDVLDVISGRIDTGISHDTRRIEIEIPTGNREGHLELKGQVANIDERDRIATALGEHPCFHDIEKRSTAAVNTERVDYQLGGIVRCGERPTKNKNSNGARAND